MGFFYSFLTSLIISLHLLGEIPYSALESAFSDNNASGIVNYGKDKILIK